MYYFIFWVSVVFFVAIIGAAIWCLIAYRASKNPQATPPGHHDVLELFWTFAPLILLIPMFHYGFKGYVQAMVAPADSIEMRVRGKQWAWDFYYPGDTEPSPAELVVARRPSREDDHVVAGRAALVLHPRVPHQARRGPRHVHLGVVRGARDHLQVQRRHQQGGGRAARPVLHRVLRHAATRRCLPRCTSSARQTTRPSSTARTSPPAGKTLAEVGAELFKKNACNTCHSVDGSAARRSLLQGAVRQDRVVRGRQQRARRRELHSRSRSSSPSEDREGLRRQERCRPSS